MSVLSVKGDASNDDDYVDDIFIRNRSSRKFLNGIRSTFIRGLTSRKSHNDSLIWSDTDDKDDFISFY